jgi:Cu-processing system permease protein
VKKIAAIAWLTVRDALRQKLAVNLLLFALLIIAASVILSELTFGEQYRIIADLTLSAAAIFGTLIAVFLGAGLVAGDIQRKTLYPIIAKPVSRTQYLLGRYAGLVTTLTLNLAVMAATSVVVLGIYRGNVGFLTRGSILVAFAGLAIQFAMVAAIAVLFSSFTNTTLAAIFTLALTAAGHLSAAAFTFWRDVPLARAVTFLLPNLQALDFKVEVVYEELVAPGRFALGATYGLLYAAVALALASVVLSRRDLR